jgi:hypothetical protein
VDITFSYWSTRVSERQATAAVRCMKQILSIFLEDPYQRVSELNQRLGELGVLFE